ncbi:MAG: hypothetical protein U1A78_17020 [Polyangia bacterium]
MGIYRLSVDVLGPWGIMDISIGTAVAAVTLVVMTAVLLSRSVPLTLAAFTVAPFMIVSNWIFARRIVEQGTHAELVARGEHYVRLRGNAAAVSGLR